ncbi:MAG: TonB-dependent receptor [Bacteroidaceae bacterium]|nr:TonB-dependent receptor [Bacteroidaceae bacterium]
MRFFFIIGVLFVAQSTMLAEEETPLREQGLSCISFNAKDIRERGLYDISDLTSVVPGLYIPSCGSAQSTAIYLRGVGSRANTPVVGLYVDDMPWLMNSSFSTKIGEVERIEVLRGPQSTLFGTNAMGGLIRIVTKNPFDYQGTFIERSMANHGSHYTGITHYQRFSDKLALSAGVAYRSMGSFFRNSNYGQKADADRSLRAHTRLLYRPTEVDNVEFLANYELCTQDAFPYYLESVSDDDPFREPLRQDIGKISSNDDNLYLRHLLNVGLKAEHNWSKVTLSNVLAFQLLNDDLDMDRDFTHLSLGTFQQQQHSRTLSEEIILKSRPGAWRHWEWVTGASFNGQWLRTCINNAGQYDTPTKRAALYHQSTMRDIFNAKGLDFTAGLRLAYEHVGCSGISLPDERLCNDWWQLMPRASLQYSFSKGNVYGTVSRGYRSAGCDCLVDNGVPQLYRPECAWNYELGTHLDLVHDKLFLDASVFLTNVTDQQITQMDPSGLGLTTKNAGQSRSCGGELSLRSMLTDRLQAHASYGYTHATFTDYMYSADVSYNGNYVPFAPQHSVDLGANYGMPMPKIMGRQLLEGMNIGVNWHGLGRIYWTEDNLVSESFYNALDAKLSFYRKHLEFAVWANNIFDNRCRTIYFLQMGRGYSQRNKPFQCGFEVKLHFN